MPIRRFIAWVTDELIVRRLSNNKTFQQFAVRMDDTLQSKQKVIQEKVTQVKGNTDGFLKTFIEDVQKEINQIKNQQPTKK
jgi:hypothetical protein